jgi:hypothetical protein
MKLIVFQFKEHTLRNCRVRFSRTGECLRMQTSAPRSTATHQSFSNNFFNLLNVALLYKKKGNWHRLTNLHIEKLDVSMCTFPECAVNFKFTALDRPPMSTHLPLWLSSPRQREQVPSTGHVMCKRRDLQTWRQRRASTLVRTTSCAGRKPRTCWRTPSGRVLSRSSWSDIVTFLALLLWAIPSNRWWALGGLACKNEK